MNYLNSLWVVPMLYSTTLTAPQQFLAPEVHSSLDLPIILWEGNHEGLPDGRKGGGTR